MKIKYTLIVAAVIMVILQTTGCSSKDVSQTPEVKEVPAQALKLIRELTGDPELQLIYLGLDDNSHNLITKDDNQKYKVNGSFDKLVSVSQKNLNIKLAKDKLNFTEAREAAKNYAVKYYPDLDELAADFNDQQEANAQDKYTFSWQRIEKGVRLPTSLKVQVDGLGGKITAFELRDYPVSINLEPVVEREEAIKIASPELSPKAKINVSSTELFTGSFSGQERIIWYVSLIIELPKAPSGDGLIYGRQVYLDANSGEIIRSEDTDQQPINP